MSGGGGGGGGCDFNADFYIHIFSPKNLENSEILELHIEN